MELVKNKNVFYYNGPNDTADIVLIHEEKILLIKRSEKSPACSGMWALPGGFVDIVDGIKEKPFETAVRELVEETGVILHHEQDLIEIGVFEGNQRDPRDNDESWSRSTAFMFELTVLPEKYKNLESPDLTEVEKIKWIDIDEIHKMNLAFDHNQIIEQALNIKYQRRNTKKICHH